MKKKPKNLHTKNVLTDDDGGPTWGMEIIVKETVPEALPHALQKWESVRQTDCRKRKACVKVKSPSH